MTLIREIGKSLPKQPSFHFWQFCPAIIQIIANIHTVLGLKYEFYNDKYMVGTY